MSAERPAARLASAVPARATASNYPEPAGFPAGTGDAHHLVNRSDGEVVLIEVGDRTAGDAVAYPDDDLVAERRDGGWRFIRKDGSPY